MRKLLLTLGLLFVAEYAMATDLIDEIIILGNKRVQNEVILSYLPYSAGMAYSQGVEESVVKAIYATGLFADVIVNWDQKNKTLQVQVKGNPQINKVAFEGNEEIDSSVLEKQISLRPRSIYSSAKISADIKTIEKMYQVQGYYLAKVLPEYIQRDQNRIDLIYKIDEGDETLIERINFIGNKAFSDADLRAVVSSKEDSWWRFLTTSDTYDEQRIAFDAEKLGSII